MLGAVALAAWAALAVSSGGYDPGDQLGGRGTAGAGLATAGAAALGAGALWLARGRAATWSLSLIHI